MRFGVDFSQWQEGLDIDQLKEEARPEFAIIRCGGSDWHEPYTDDMFEANYEALEKAEIPTGAFYLANAKSEEEARKEAEHCLSILGDRKFDLPIYYDVEGECLGSMNTDIVKAFCDRIREGGFRSGIYGSEYNLNEILDWSRLVGDNSIWIARYSATEPKLNGGYPIDLWQYGGDLVNYYRSPIICGMPLDQDFMLRDIIEKKPEPKLTKYAIGNVIKYDKIYASSYSDKALEPLFNYGTITDIIPGRPNPYLVDAGTGWVNDGCIVSCEGEYDKYNLRVGTVVKFKNIHISSTSEDNLTPLVNQGTITYIAEGTPNKYLIDDVIGWVSPVDITDVEG